MTGGSVGPMLPTNHLLLADYKITAAMHSSHINWAQVPPPDGCHSSGEIEVAVLCNWAYCGYKAERSI